MVLDSRIGYFSNRKKNYSLEVLIYKHKSCMAIRIGLRRGFKRFLGCSGVV